jgi:hypothetical protein
MSNKNIEPPENLLDSIEEIATLKKVFSLRDRSLTSANGLYVQSGSLPGYGTQYMAGGEFIAKLVFVRKPDGSREITKYQPGDWEDKVNETLQLCRQLIHLDDATKIGSGRNVTYLYDNTIISDLLKEVFEHIERHHNEIDTQWQLFGFPRGIELLNVFLDELKEKWPTEYSELTNAQAGEKDMETLLEGDSGTLAWVFGYMSERGWISHEKLMSANIIMGELLAKEVRSNRRQAKSKGIAFAAAFGRISDLGSIDARIMKKGTGTNSQC